jgi:hypothetical protein
MNREKNNASTARWAAANPERKKEADARWAAEHPEKAKAKGAKWYTEHSEKVKIAAAKWAAEHPEKVKAIKSKWSKTHPLVVRAQNSRRNARKRSAIGSYTASEFRVLCDESSWQCSYCAAVLDIKTVQADHVVPLSRGGSNYIKNIAVACKPCNASKNNTPLPVWLSRTGRTAFGPNLLSNTQPSQ